LGPEQLCSSLRAAGMLRNGEIYGVSQAFKSSPECCSHASGPDYRHAKLARM